MNTAKNTLQALIITLLVFCLPVPATAEPELHLAGDFHYAPLASEEFYRPNGYNLRTGWLLAQRRGDFTTGMKIAADFRSLSPQATINTLSGPQFKLSGSWVNLYRITEALTLDWNCGLFWQQHAFAPEGSILRHYLGWTLGNRLIFQVPGLDFLYLELNTLFDLGAVLAEGGEERDYMLNSGAGFRLSFHPGLEWLQAYVAVNGALQNYAFPAATLRAGQVEFGTGLIIQLDWASSPSPLPETPAPTLIPPTPPPTPVPTPTPTPTPPYWEPGLTVLETGVPGEVAGFRGIQFAENSPELTPGSLPLLSAIAAILRERPEQKVSVASYAIFTQNPVADRDLHVARSRRIRQFLVDRGVTADNIRITAGAILLLSLDDDRPRVTFTLDE